MIRANRPEAVLTFLAPAQRCNQRCPRCLLDLMGEPVREFRLTPSDYARFLSQFLESGIPVKVVAFQGFEVTLGPSWPYVEATLRIAQSHGIRRAFLTNGMRLHHWTECVRALGPLRVAVSLDGACPGQNDRIRGVPGAFDATLRSVKRFLRSAPECAGWMSIASCVYDKDNFRSLLGMPRLLQSLGIFRWSLAAELTVKDGRQAPAHSIERVRSWMGELALAGSIYGVQVHMNDEFEFYGDGSETDQWVRHLFHPELFYRVWPSGHVGVGREVLDTWDPNRLRQWDPEHSHAPDVVDYWSAARRIESSRSGASLNPVLGNAERCRPR